MSSAFGGRGQGHLNSGLRSGVLSRSRLRFLCRCGVAPSTRAEYGTFVAIFDFGIGLLCFGGFKLLELEASLDGLELQLQCFLVILLLRIAIYAIRQQL